MTPSRLLPVLLLALPVLALPASGQDPPPSLRGQLPKEELGVRAWLEAWPERDGRGIRVAVLDTGVDPGHPFLQGTPAGGRKIVDWYDVTTDGRLDTSTVGALDADGCLPGLSGRKLRPGGHAVDGAEFRLGLIDADWLPDSLAGRILEERRRRFEEEQERRVEAALLEGHPAPEPGEFQDPGPRYDVVLVRAPGADWKVVVDTDEDGDLGEERALRGFRESGDWATLGAGALLNFAVQVEDGGDRCQVFFDTNGHGTHVAGILGAWAGPGSRLNGLAPGVEIVAIKIGDGKFGGATTGFAIAKALDLALESGCQVANISFGGSSFFADGREPDSRVLEEAVRRGLVVVTSAGNEGPTLSTVGAPGTSPAAIAVAAAIGPDTARVNYGSLGRPGPLLFDFSSRGPLPGGGLGVDFTAPGAALSSLPSWLLTPAENFNGTSMAAPQITGLCALLLGAAREEGLAVDPPLLRRALRLGSVRLEGFEGIEQGFGMPRAGRAWEALQRLAASGREEIGVRVRVENPHGAGGGIYERRLAVRDRVFERLVRIEPDFAPDAAPERKAGFLRTYRLEAEDDWIEIPDAVYLSAGGRAFPVRVDPRRLRPGLNASCILLWDVEADPSLGPDAVVPVTLILPERTEAAGDHELHRRFEIVPGGLERTFVEVPAGATVARVRLHQEGPGRNEFRTGAGSVSGFRYSGQRQVRGRFFLEDGSSAEQSVPVEPGTVLEYTVASRWSVNRPVRLDLEIRFEGLVGQHEECVVPAGQGMAWYAVKSLLRTERGVRARAVVEGVAQPVTAPMRMEPDPIRSRVLGGHALFHGVVEWPVTVPEGAKLSLRTPRSLQTTEVREDLMFEAVDASGKVIQRKVVEELETALDALAPGDYLFRLRYPSLGRHPLEARFAGVELRMSRTPVTLPLDGDLLDAFRGRGALGGLTIPFGGARSLGARVPELEPLADGAWYYGSLRFENASGTLLEVPLRIERPGGAEASPPAAEVSRGGAAPAEAGSGLRRVARGLRSLLEEILGGA